MLDGNSPSTYIQPQPNLLVNADFAKPINTVGYTWGAVRTGLEAINRWIVAGSLRQENGTIVLYTGDSVGWMYQEIKRDSIDLAGKTVTLTVEGGAPDGVGAVLKINNIGGDTLGTIDVNGEIKTASFTVTVPDNYTAITVMFDHFSADTQPGSKVCNIKNLKLEIGSHFTGFYPINPETNILQTLGNYTDKIFRYTARESIDGKDVNTVVDYGSYAKNRSASLDSTPNYPYIYGLLDVISGTGENKPVGAVWRYTIQVATAGDGSKVSMRQAMCPEDPTDYQFSEWREFAMASRAEITLLNGWMRQYAWDTLDVVKNGNIVTINIAYMANASNAVNGSVIFILRKDMWPIGNMLGQIYNADTGVLLTQVLIHTDGSVSIRGQDIPANTPVTISCSFITS